MFEKLFPILIESQFELIFYRYSGLNDEENDAFMKRAAANIPLQRVARDEEIAKAVIYLTSEL